MSKISIAYLLIFSILLVGCSDDAPEEFQSAFNDYITKTELEIPFESEEWYVAWGGRTIDQNQHADMQEQRFAIDFIQVFNDSNVTGSGDKNEDYYCFGKRLNAPGAGKVIELENNVLDNDPGELNSNEPMGNYLMIDHGNNEFSVLAHFKYGSIKVSVGDEVQKGQELGEVGNSGNSSEPHLHYHMQNSSNLMDSDGLPVQFLNYYANGVLIERGEPQKDEILRRKE